FLRSLLDSGRQISLPAGQHICLEGSNCSHLAFVLSGTGRVYKLGESGREITLYRVDAGECCILTLSCIISEKRFPAFAVSESDLEAILVPASVIQDWMDSIRSWRRFAWNLITARLGDVISLVEEVTFRRMDERLGFYLNQADKFPL
ncbi:Crp/Fnr family transcriptional regulator, partial [Thiolapillus sp.]